MCGARGSEVQRAEATVRHQGRSQQGGVNFLGSEIPGVYLNFFHNTGGLSRENCLGKIVEGKMSRENCLSKIV